MNQIIFDIEQEFADTHAHYGELPNIQQGLDGVEKAYKELWLEAHGDDADQQYVKAMNVAVSALRIMHLLNEEEARRLCDVDVCDGFHGNNAHALVAKGPCNCGCIKGQVAKQVAEAEANNSAW